MTAASSPDTGPLRDHGSSRAEQEATMALFWGATGVFKNPSHREVGYGSPTFASQVVMCADLLLRILDGIEWGPLAEV
jgi:hypothetical protein